MRNENANPMFPIVRHWKRSMRRSNLLTTVWSWKFWIFSTKWQSRHTLQVELIQAGIFLPRTETPRITAIILTLTVRQVQEDFNWVRNSPFLFLEVPNSVPQHWKWMIFREWSEKAKQRMIVKTAHVVAVVVEFEEEQVEADVSINFITVRRVIFCISFA